MGGAGKKDMKTETIFIPYVDILYTHLRVERVLEHGPEGFDCLTNWILRPSGV